MLRATGRVLKFPGYLAVYGQEAEDTASASDSDNEVRVCPARASSHHKPRAKGCDCLSPASVLLTCTMPPASSACHQLRWQGGHIPESLFPAHRHHSVKIYGCSV